MAGMKVGDVGVLQSINRGTVHSDNSHPDYSFLILGTPGH